MPAALSLAGGFLVVCFLWWAARRAVWSAVHHVVGATEVTGQPFSEEDYGLNLVESQSWEIRNAIRRAGTLAQKGRTAEAVAVLEKVKAAVPDERVRTALDREIARLRGPEPSAPVPEQSPPAPSGRSGGTGGTGDEWPYPTSYDTV
jgi:hypothetical protein